MDLGKVHLPWGEQGVRRMALREVRICGRNVPDNAFPVIPSHNLCWNDRNAFLTANSAKEPLRARPRRAIQTQGAFMSGDFDLFAPNEEVLDRCLREAGWTPRRTC